MLFTAEYELYIFVYDKADRYFEDLSVINTSVKSRFSEFFILNNDSKLLSPVITLSQSSINPVSYSPDSTISLPTGAWCPKDSAEYVNILIHSMNNKFSDIRRYLTDKHIKYTKDYGIKRNLDSNLVSELIYSYSHESFTDLNKMLFFLTANANSTMSKDDIVMKDCIELSKTKNFYGIDRFNFFKNPDEPVVSMTDSDKIVEMEDNSSILKRKFDIPIFRIQSYALVEHDKGSFRSGTLSVTQEMYDALKSSMNKDDSGFTLRTSPKSFMGTIVQTAGSMNSLWEDFITNKAFYV